MIQQQRVMQALVILSALFVTSASAAAIIPCPRPCKCFTADNGILAANCTDLPDQITTAWPQKILRIHFDGSHASPIMLKNKAFKNFPQLTFLDITGGTVQYVGNSAFDGLPDLVELNLVGTGIRKLHRDTFATNRKLAFLSLKNNPKLAVTPSFLASESITELDLSECGLVTLKSVYFKNLPSLKYMFVMKNKLKSLGSQFGPPGLKYVNLAHNYIENIYEDLDAYKRLRTIDLTGNPINCTCELSEIDKKLTARGVAFGNTIICKNTEKPLSDMAEVCSDQEMMGDDPMDMYQADNLLKIDKNTVQSIEDFMMSDSGSGSGSGDGEVLFTVKSTTAHTQTESVQNTTAIIGDANSTAQVEEAEENVTPIYGIESEITTTNVSDVFAGSSSTEQEAETSEITKTNVSDVFAWSSSTEQESETEITPTPESRFFVLGKVDSSSSNEITEETSRVAADEVIVNVAPTVRADNSTTTRSGADGGIVPLTIQAPEDEANVQTKVAEYLKSNVGITGTAVLVILAVVIVAIVYKAVCLGRSRRRSSVASDKVVELKEIKYTAANTDDMPPPAGSPAEENLLGDRGSDDDDDDGDGDDDDEDDDDDAGHHHGDDGTVEPLTSNGGLPRNGLSNGDAAKPGNNNAVQPPTTPKIEVPTRVIVRLSETPKASKPITINNVH